MKTWKSFGALVGVSLLGMFLLVAPPHAQSAAQQPVGCPQGTGGTCLGSGGQNTDTWIIGGGNNLARFQTNGSSSFGNGSASAPALSFLNDSDTGFYYPSLSGDVALANDGNTRILWANNLQRFGSGASLAWSANADPTLAGNDTTLSRASAGIFGTTTSTFATLGTPANGAFTMCTDCAPTTPATCPGTKASCVCTGSGAGSIAVRVNSTWYCPF